MFERLELKRTGTFVNKQYRFTFHPRLLELLLQGEAVQSDRRGFQQAQRPSFEYLLQSQWQLCNGNIVVNNEHTAEG